MKGDRHRVLKGEHLFRPPELGVLVRRRRTDCAHEVFDGLVLHGVLGLVDEGSRLGMLHVLVDHIWSVPLVDRRSAFRFLGGAFALIERIGVVGS